MSSPKPLSETKRKLVARLLAQRAVRGAPSERPPKLPLSHAQRRLWLLDQLEGPSARYNMPVALCLRGPLQVASLSASFDALVARHEILRTRFRSDDGLAYQDVMPSLPSFHRYVDGGDLDDAAVRALLAEEAASKFDLATGPLLRTTLVRRDDQLHVLLINMHHIVSDAWSSGVIIRELVELYRSRVHGRSPALPEVVPQYADYALWQTGEEQRATVQRQLEYWKRQLHGVEALDLPLDRARPPSQSTAGATETRVIAAELVERLSALARENAVTLFMVLVAAWKTLLFRYSGQSDLTTGCPSANRTRSEFEATVGPFLNVMVLRTNLAGNPTFRRLLQRIKPVTLDALANQDVPFELLVEALHPARDLAHTPLFQVMFTLESVPIEPLRLTEISVEPLPVHSGSARFDLSLSLANVTEGLVCALEYRSELFDAATIREMLSSFEGLLLAVATDPDCRISELPLVERERESSEPNVPHSPEPHATRAVHELFARQVQRTPDAIAASYEGLNVSYAALARRAERVSAHLRRLGVGPDVLVGVCMEPSLDVLVALLGVLKAGGAYVPLDPLLPLARRLEIAAQCELAVLVLDACQRDEMRASALSVVTLKECLLGAADAGPRRGLDTLDSRAYLVFTSGSTGSPKGVEVTHRGLANVLQSFLRTPGLRPADRVLAFAPIGFDIATAELLLPLLVGAHVRMLPRMTAVDGHRFRAELERSQATVVQATPSTWRMLDHAGWPARSSLRLALSTGEALSTKLAGMLCQRVPEVWNLYGPSETTIWSTRARIYAEPAVVPLGEPIANTRLHLLGQQRERVPRGAKAGLYVGGHGVARGYLRDAKLTAERFVPDPFACEAGGRLYDTGDLVRETRADGLEFLGRGDFQVKLRGYRIELQEIERAVCSFPGVREAAVLMKIVDELDQRLIAFMLSSEHVATLPLRKHLRASLPDYMIPSRFIPITEWPRTHNGKLDRAALERMADVDPAHRLALQPRPLTAHELRVAAIWKDVLKVAELRPDDNFFDLGGHSLLVVQATSRLERELGYRPEFRDFLQQTFAQFAASCGRGVAGA